MDYEKHRVLVGQIRKHPTHGYGYDLVNSKGAYSFRACGDKENARFERDALLNSLKAGDDIVEHYACSTSAEFKVMRPHYEKESL